MKYGGEATAALVSDRMAVWMASTVTGLRVLHVEIVQPGRIQSTSEYPFTFFRLPPRAQVIESEPSFCLRLPGVLAQRLWSSP